MRNNRVGCLGILAILVAAAFIIQYWYVIVAIAIIAGLIYWLSTKSQREAAKIAAAKKAEEAELDRKIEQLRKYKELLDEGIITQAEFEEKKSSLNFNDLRF
ncbi:MAG: SHOCT domain-containing protein [Bacillota bacterium]|nr:SHOCT domain-containing protein [Bacillota bacterium]